MTREMLKNLFLMPIVMVWLLSGCSSAIKESNEYAYSLMFEFPKNQKEWILGRLDRINLKTLELEASFKADSAIKNITVHQGRVLMSYYRDEGRSLKKVTEFFPEIREEKQIVETLGVSPKGVIPVNNKLYIRVDGMRIPESKVLKNNNNKRRYQKAGYEIYTDSKRPQYRGSVLLGQYDNISSFDIQETEMYITVVPIDVIDERYPSGIRYNAFDDSFLMVIDTENDVVKQRLDISSKVRNVRGIKVIGEKIYITASHTSNYEGGLHGESHREYIFEKENPGKEYKRKKQFQTASNRHVTIFDKDLELIKKIPITVRSDEIYHDPLNNYVIVEHKPLWLRDKTGYLSIIDLSTDTVVKSFKIPKYKMMSLVSKDTLLISSENGLFIFDTKQLGVIKEFPGYYAPISVNYSKEKFKIEREVTLPVIQTEITEVDMNEEFPEGRRMKVSRYKTEVLN